MERRLRTLCPTVKRVEREAYGALPNSETGGREAYGAGRHIPTYKKGGRRHIHRVYLRVVYIPGYTSGC